MAFENWQFRQLTRSGGASKFGLSGYSPSSIDAKLPEPPLRLLLVDDEWAHMPDAERSGRDAQAFCREFLTLEDGSAPVEPTVPVLVFFTDSFALERDILAHPEEFDFDGILQDLKEDDDFPGERNLRPMRTSTVTPKPGVLVVTQHAAEEVLQRCKAGLSNRFAIRKTGTKQRRPPRDIAEIKAFFRYAMLRRELRVSPVAEELRRFVGIGTLAKVVEFLRKIKRDDVPDLRLPIVILGATGTGKEHLARLIHAQDRVVSKTDKGAGKKPPEYTVDFAAFVPVLVGAIGEGVMEGEIFGVEKLQQMPPVPGYARDAQHGTLFFDELADIPLGIQGKLLRFLETNEVRPIGGSWTKVKDVRVVFATHSEERLHDRQHFREDFVQRIDGLTFRLPTLAERVDEHQLLIDHFLARELARQRDPERQQEQPTDATGEEARLHAGVTLEDAIKPQVVEHLLELCQSGELTGNVRQLDHFIRRLVRVSEPGAPIGLSELDLAMEFSLIRPGRGIAVAGSDLPSQRHPLEEIFEGLGWNDFVQQDRWAKGRMMHTADERGFKTSDIVAHLVRRQAELLDGELEILDTSGNPVAGQDQQALIGRLSSQYARNKANWIGYFKERQRDTLESAS